MKYKEIKLGDNKSILVDEYAEIKVNDFITDNYTVWKWLDDSSLLGRKKVIATINYSISLDVAMVIVEDQVYSEKDLIDLVQQLKDYTKVGQFILGNDEREAKEFVDIFIQPLKQKYIELETEPTEQFDEQTSIGVFTIKTTRVDGQLIAYIKK